MPETTSAYERARARVDRRFGFYRHVGTFLFVNAVLLGVNLWTSPNDLWVKWPLALWGVFVVWEGVKVFFFESPRLQDARKRALERELAREQELERHHDEKS